VSTHRTNLTCLVAGLTGALAGACGDGAPAARPCGFVSCDSGAGAAITPPASDGGDGGATDGGYALGTGPAIANFDIGSVQKSAGCGKALPATQPTTVTGTPSGYLEYTVMLTGTTLAGTDPTRASPRTFWVRVPAHYDPNRAYRIVYLSAGCGGFEVANTSTYPLYDESQGGTEQAVYVALDHPRDMHNGDCFDTRGGLGSEEWETFAAVQDLVDSTYCVDDNAIFVDSWGDDSASLSNMWGCYFAGNPVNQRLIAPARHVRGQSSLSGGEPPGMPACGGPIAALWIHDTLDNSGPISADIQALDRVLAGNGCQGDHASSPSTPWPSMPDVCLQYTSCPADYPVVFCTTTGFGHGSQPDRAIPAFTAFADLVSPQTSSPHPKVSVDAGTIGVGATDAGPSDAPESQ
jgi:hypothetical protein